MSRRLPTPPLIQGASVLCTAWLQRAGGELCSEVKAALPALTPARRGYAAAPSAAATAAPEAAGLPPSWVPPPNNPENVNPKPQPTISEILHSIRTAKTPLELHNAYRRKPASLPPHVAAAKFSRLGELLRAARPSGAPASRPQLDALNQPGVGKLLKEVGDSWHTFLHLFTAEQLAACVRAAGETGLLMREAPEEGGSQGGSGEGSSGAGAAAASAAGGSKLGLVKRSLAVLLDRGGEELAGAGPTAVVDVAYGLMAAGHSDAATWRTLAPLLATAQQLLEARGKEAGREAAAVRSWLQERGIQSA